MESKKINQKYKNLGYVFQKSAPLIHPYFPMSFNMSAGFVQLDPYIRGKKTDDVNKILTTQKCIRHFDLKRAGLDKTHLTFFEMWGGLTLGEVDWSTLLKCNLETLIDTLGIDVAKLTFSVFGGDQIHGKIFEEDKESREAWLRLGIKKDQIHIGDFSNTFWFQGGDDLDDKTKGSPFDTRLCGYQTEIFYDLTGKPCGDKCGPFCDCDRWLEISNNLNISYDYSLKTKTFKQLDTPATETVIGLERLMMVLEGKTNVWEIERLKSIVDNIQTELEVDLDSARVLVDRLRALVFLAAEKLPEPGQNGRNRIVRRMMRDVLTSIYKVDTSEETIISIISKYSRLIVEQYQVDYPELVGASEKLTSAILAHHAVYVETIRRSKESIKHAVLRGEIKEIDENQAEKLRLKLGIPTKLIKMFFPDITTF